VHLKDKEKVGFFNAWFGFILGCREQKEGLEYLHKSLKIGDKFDSNMIIGYACTWLSWICAEQGRLDDAIAHGKRAQDISKILESDHYLYFKSLGGIAHTYVYKGELKKVLEAGKMLLDYGQRHSSVRSIFMGYVYMGHSYQMTGNFRSAAEYFQKAIQVSVDPIYSMGAELSLIEHYIQNGQYQEAEDIAHGIVNYSQKYGCEVWGTPASMFLGIISMAKGSMSQGLRMIEEAQQLWFKMERFVYYALSEWVLGKVYLQIVEGANPISLSTMVKNLGFLAKNVPFASKKAEDHLKKAIKVAQDIGAKGYLAQALLDLGKLHRLKKRTADAKECISKAIELFEQCEAEVYLKQARDDLASLRGM
jgi:tetratricopeptide (TPR) repeat protein